jgi:hypothetical protein
MKLRVCFAPYAFFGPSQDWGKDPIAGADAKFVPDLINQVLTDNAT